LSVIEYGQTSKNVKESVLSMCFVPNDFLIIATDANNYYIKLDEKMFWGKNKITETIDENMSNEEAINFLTSAPESQRKKTFAANVVLIENTSDQNISFKDEIRSNKIVFYKKVLSKINFWRYM